MPRINLPVEEVVARYETGESTHELGRAYGVAHVTIMDRLHHAGAKMRTRGEAGGRPPGRHKPGGPFSVSTGRGWCYLRTRGRDGKSVRIHRGCWEAYNGPVPNGHVVHHINGNTLDNRIENLACMLDSEHAQMHKCVI